MKPKNWIFFIKSVLKINMNSNSFMKPKFFYETKIWIHIMEPTFAYIYIVFFHGTKVLMPSVTVYTIQEYFTALNSTEVYLDGCQYATCSCQVLKSAWLCKVMRVLTSSHHLFTLFHSICLILDLMKSQSRNTRFNCYVCSEYFQEGLWAHLTRQKSRKAWVNTGRK